MNKIAKLLMERDNLSQDEAETAVRECRNMLFIDTNDAETIIMEELGLEPDYLFDILDMV